MHREFRKPLILMTPKSLLRHKLAVSNVDMFTGTSTFHRFLWDDDHKTLARPDKIRRVILCTGKVYYDLLEERRKRKIDDITIVRVEQVYPFPSEGLGKELKPYENADIVWCQEEPKNQGAWSFVDPLIERMLETSGHKAGRARYAGRPASASPATGLLSRHQTEQAKLLDEALTI